MGLSCEPRSPNPRIKTSRTAFPGRFRHQGERIPLCPQIEPVVLGVGRGTPPQTSQHWLTDFIDAGASRPFEIHRHGTPPPIGVPVLPNSTGQSNTFPGPNRKCSALPRTASNNSRLLIREYTPMPLTQEPRKKVLDSLPYDWYSVLNEDIVVIVSESPELI